MRAYRGRILITMAIALFVSSMGNANSEGIDPRDILGQTMTCLDYDAYVSFSERLDMSSRMYLNTDQNFLLGPKAKDQVVRIDVLTANSRKLDALSPRHHFSEWFLVLVTKNSRYCLLNGTPGHEVGFHLPGVLSAFDYFTKPDSERKGWRIVVVDENDNIIE